MRIGKQLSVVLPNKPGALVALCRRFARAKVNIRAMAIAETTEQGVVRVVVDKTAVARKALEQGGLAYLVVDVVLVEMPNKPGMFAKILSTLERAGVNVNFTYGSTGPGARDAIAVLGVSDLAKVKKLLA